MFRVFPDVCVVFPCCSSAVVPDVQSAVDGRSRGERKREGWGESDIGADLVKQTESEGGSVGAAGGFGDFVFQLRHLSFYSHSQHGCTRLSIAVAL